MYRLSKTSDYSFDSLTASLAFASDPWPSLSDTFVYDTEEGSPVSNVSTVAWGPLSASLSMKSSKTYHLDSSGWATIGDESFRASVLSMALKSALKNKEGSPFSWSLGTNATLSQSLLRFTESSLTLAVTASLKVNDLVSISFSSQSQNSAAWRYYPELFDVSLDYWPDAYRRSFIADVADSLSIWDTEALERGLFKLKSLSFKMVHDLHDWDLTVEASVSPLLKSISSTKKYYVLDPELSIVLKWKDISEIKTEATYDSDGFSY
jgi:hypothetical protein